MNGCFFVLIIVLCEAINVRERAFLSSSNQMTFLARLNVRSSSISLEDTHMSDCYTNISDWQVMSITYYSFSESKHTDTVLDYNRIRWICSRLIFIGMSGWTWEVLEDLIIIHRWEIVHICFDCWRSEITSWCCIYLVYVSWIHVYKKRMLYKRRKCVGVTTKNARINC